MNEKKEFLTEENYEKAKKKVMRTALIVFIIGILIGGSLITIGVIKTNEVKKYNEKVAEQIEQNNKYRTKEVVQADIDKIQLQIDEIHDEITNLETEISKLNNEKQKIFMEDKGFSERYYAKDEEITAKENEIDAKRSESSKLRDKLSSYESELWKITSGYNDSKIEIEKDTNSISSAKYIFLCTVGGIITFVFCMISLSIYLFGKRREITAFKAQQVMPVAQEGIEKMAPTIGKAGATISKEMAPVYGNIAKEISKGIKEGIKDDDKKED